MQGVRRAAGPEGRFGRFSWNPALRAFMRAQDIQYILATWGLYLPPERIHLVTVPSGADRTLLWERFAGVVGVDPGGAQTSRTRPTSRSGTPRRS